MESPEAIKTWVAEPEAPVMVRVDGLQKKFGKITALRDVSFFLRKGEILGLLGPNGAGKTTTMRILAGFFSPTQGKVWIGEKNLFSNPQAFKQKIGYLPESLGIYRDMKVMEFLDFVAKIKGVRRKQLKKEVEDKLSQCGLWDVKSRMIGHLSKGYRQRLGIAQALVGDPDILLLDEPTSGLDPKQIMEIRSLIRDLGKERTLVLSTHILPEVSMICDRVLILNEGRVAAAGTTDELEAGLQSGSGLTIGMGDRHRKEEAIALLKAVPGVHRVSLVEEHGDRVYLSLSVAKGTEVRPEINRMFVEKRIPLLELRSERLSLEEIFLKLVVKEPSLKGIAV